MPPRSISITAQNIAPLWSLRSEQKKACVEEHTNARDYLPWWYVLVAWPEGITTWAIIFTGFAIAWQSWETRKSAKASRDAIILTHRPKIAVRSLVLSRDKSDNFEVKLVLRNSGSTIAHISGWKLFINWLIDTEVVGTHVEDIAQITLKPGEALTFKFTAPEFYVRFEASRLLLEENPGQDPTVALGCVATISYTDGIGTKRDTALNRVYNYRTKEFTIWNKEADYSD